MSARDAGPVAAIVPNGAPAGSDVGWARTCNRCRAAGLLPWSVLAGLRPAAPTWRVESPPGATGLCPDYRYDTYELERIGFARRLVATTDRAFTMVTAQGPIAWRVRPRLVPLVARLLFRLAAVRRLLFRTVSQIGVNYRDSPLSEGVAGSVQGGDRLPRVETVPNEDNFAALTALAWQVHVYGEPPRGAAEACADLGLPLDQLAWHPAKRRSGLMRGALYVVRPAGYVAPADPDGDPERLRRYFMSRSLPVALRRDEATRLEPAPVRPGLPGVNP